MQVQGIDERRLVSEHNGGNFVLFIYTGDGSLQTSESVTSWAVDSLLITNAALSDVLSWLTENLPTDTCWSLGVVREPAQPSPDTDINVSWIVGSDVLNISPSNRSPDQQRIAAEMLDRRHHVAALT